MAKRACKFMVYKAEDGWRWRLVSSNGKIIADGAEAYVRRPNILRLRSGLVEKIFKADCEELP